MKTRIAIKHLNKAIKLSGQSQFGFINAIRQKFNINPKKIRDYVNRTK